MAQNNAGSSVAPALDRSGRAASIRKGRRLGVALVLSGAALAGAFVSVALPRGPTTQSQALLVLVGSVIVGVIAGLAMRSRWAMLLAPLVHIIALELARPQILGPTVGAIRLDETYGVLAFVLGRGLYGLVAIIPMILGAYLGTVVARELLGATLPLGSVFVRWVPTALATLALVGLITWIALPASTPPILGADGAPLPGSITELTTVRLGGHDQTIMIRGYSADKPVLLYLNGGPGQSGLPFTRVVLDDLSRDFVIVDWDQRGAGTSYAALDPTATLTLDQAINDTIELTNELRQRFDEPKIYVVGESWGSILGVLAVQRQPELFYAFIGSGQMVSIRETDQRIYQDVLDLAARNGDQALAAKMRSYGQPPYADIPYANAFVMEQYDGLYKPYTPSQAYIALGSASGIGPYGVLASEYNLIEKFNVLRGLLDTFTVLYPQLQALDFRRDVKRLEVPVYLLDGKAELSARRDLALEWFSALQAPGKQLFPIENAAHSVAFEQFEQFDTMMRETVLPATYRGR
ncbi:MAG: alpha/beta hydrolase [Oscillochloris sp.]|nr:alpha/beta hydrolase [Oscillochloris sp.]